MEQTKKEKLVARGWKAMSVQEFLGLTDEEMAAIEEKISATTMAVKVAGSNPACDC